MRWLFTMLLSMMVAASALAQSGSPNNVLAQLGVKGVTDKIYGTNAALYANYLVKTYTNGLIDISLMPTEANPHRWYKTAFIDSVNGLDSTNSGTAVCPYKTFAYAANLITNDTAFVLTPGTYTAATITNANAHHVALIGLDPTNTVMTGILNFNASLPMGTMDVSVYLSGVTVQDIRQYQYGTLLVEAYNRAKVTGNITRLYTTTNSYGTLFADPSASIANLITGSNCVNYVKAYIASGTAGGQLAYWDGTNWNVTGVGSTNQVLYGGTLPFWGNATVVYTNTAIPGDFTPAISNAYSLGSQTLPWSNGWFGTAIYINGADLMLLFANLHSNNTYDVGTTQGLDNATFNEIVGVRVIAGDGNFVDGTVTTPATSDYQIVNYLMLTNYVGTNATLDAVCQRGSNTTANVSLRGNWVSIGSNTGTEIWGTQNGINLGHNIGTRTNLSQGSINAGRIGSAQGVQTIASSAARGSMNFGSFDTSSSPMIQYLIGIGALNYGSLSSYGKQYAIGASAINIGRVTEGLQTNEGVASFNFGLVGSGITDVSPSFQRIAVGANGAMNLGSVSGANAYQELWGAGAVNIGAVSDGGQYVGSGSGGSMNMGEVSSGYQIIGGPGCFNLGRVNSGTQYVNGYGAMNIGMALVGGAQTNGGAGSFNLGSVIGGWQTIAAPADASLNFGSVYIGARQYVDGTSVGVLNVGNVGNSAQQIQTNTALGSLNFGMLDASALQVQYGSKGSMNLGYLTGSKQYASGMGAFNMGYLPSGGIQTNTANGAFILGGSGTNTHDNSVLLGAGLRSQETNSVNARKYYENGTPLSTTYATYPAATNIATTIVTNYIVGSGHMYMSEIGVTSVLYHVTSAGHTNKIGEFYTP